MPRYVLALVAYLFVVAGPAYAQSLFPGVPGEAQPADETADPATGPDPAIEALTDVLRDDAARQRLLEALEQAGAADAAAAAPAEPEPTTLGQEIAALTQEASQSAARTLNDMWRGVKRLPSAFETMLETLWSPQFIASIQNLFFVVVVTYLGLFALRGLLRPAQRYLSAQVAVPRSTIALIIAAVAAVLDAVAVFGAWAAGYAMTVAISDGFGAIRLQQSLFLNAFLLVELVRTVARSLFAPRQVSLRIVPAGDVGARRTYRWLSNNAFILGFGLMLVVPLVSQSVGFLQSRALALAISVLVVLGAVVRVLIHRRDVARWMHPEAYSDDNEEPQPILAQLAMLWHWPALAYLLFILVLVLSRPGNVLISVLQTSAIILGVVLAGVIVDGMLERARSRGVRLGASLRSRLPLLEPRLNAFVPRVFRALQLLLAAGITAVILHAIGVWDLWAWLGSATGTRFATTILTVAVILIVAFFIWLAIASWVDFRLNPRVGRPPSSREITLLSLLKNAVTIALLVLALMFTFSELGLDIAPLLASAGVLGLAIGFGAQKLVQDIITGIFIQFDNAINVGDVVSLGGITGVVEKLTVRSVSMRDLHGVFHIIPFSSVDTVSNYMRDFSFHVCDMGIAYREDTDVAKQAMMDAFEELRQTEHGLNILGDLEYMGLDAFGDSAVVLRARIKTIPGKQWEIGRAYNEILKKLFDARGIEIPFPHQTIYFGEDREGKAPPMNIRMAGPQPDRPKKAPDNGD